MFKYITWLLFTLWFLLEVQPYRYAWRPDTKVFPYDKVPPPSRIDNGDNDGKILQDYIGRMKLSSLVKKCIDAWRGDGKCNSDNNKDECKYDNGDCCARSCMRQCREIYENNTRNESTFAILRRVDRVCPFECGVLGYQCVQPNQGCYTCNLTNAECRSQSDCFENNGPMTSDQFVLDTLDNCQALSWSMGNIQTINSYCGQDPFFTVVHDVNDRLVHFDGCGVPKEQCTKRPCCTDALKYRLNSTSCDKDVKTYEFFDPESYAFSNKTTSCLAHFKECFRQNYEAQGQCCQCKPGWTGIDCNQAVCFPDRRKKKRSGCVHGVCIGPDVCVCQEGWTGDQCDLGICTSCINGRCIGPDECDCWYGWEGADCSIGVSHPSCLHGFAIRPDFCQCDDGWIGRACDVPNCTYGCGNGYCKDSEICECKPGWYSTNYKTPCDAMYPSMIHPQCKKNSQSPPYQCQECKFNYYLDSSGQCQRCDLKYLHCYECTEKRCLGCQWPYFNVTKFNSSSGQFDISECVSYGIFEVSQDTILVDESQQYFDLRIVRMYHDTNDQTFTENRYDNIGIWNSNGELEEMQIVEQNTIEIDYDIMPAYTSRFEADTRIEKKRDTLTFNYDENEKRVIFKIFKRQYFEDKPEFTKFYFNMRFSTTGGELKYDAKQITIYYYDAPFDSDMLDIRYTLSRHMGNVQNEGQYIDQKIGQEYFFNFFSYFKEDQPKTNGKDIFFLRLITYDQETLIWGQQDYVFGSSFESGNQYRINYLVKSKWLTELRLYASCKGFNIRYYRNMDLDNYPILERIEPQLPGVFDSQYMYMTYFRAIIEFTVNLRAQGQYDGSPQLMEFGLSVNSGVQGSLYFDGKKVIEIEENFRVKNTISCKASDTYFEVNYVTGESQQTGCCLGPNREYLLTFQFPDAILDGSEYHHFKIDYIHHMSNSDVKYKQSPCIKVFKRTVNNNLIPFSEIILDESYALTELKDSPYKVNIIIDTTLIDIYNIQTNLVPWTDPNTGKTYTHIDNRTLGVGQLHQFTFIFYDIYGNRIPEVLLLKPPYYFVFEDEYSKGLIKEVSYSYVDLINERQIFSIIIYKSVVNNTEVTNQGKISVTFFGQDIINTPFKHLRVLPGLMNLTTSVLVEENLKSSYLENPNLWKRSRCYIGDTCTVKITLKDSYCNNLDQQYGLIDYDWFSLMIIGPFNNTIWPSQSRYHQNLTQDEDGHPEYYYINFEIQKVGNYDIYTRFKKPNQPVLYPRASMYPVKIEAFSDKPSELFCEFFATYHFVGDVLVTMLAKDKFQSILTDNGVLFNATLNYMEIGENPQPKSITEADQYLNSYYEVFAKSENFTDFGDSYYSFTMYPIRRGYYNLTVYVCKEFENQCSDDMENGEYYTLAMSPEIIYLTTQFPFPQYAVARGTGLKYSIVNNLEIYYVQIKDHHLNNFDIYNDELHQGVTYDKWVKTYITFEYDDPDYVGGTQYSIRLKEWDLFNGLFQFEYIIKETFFGQMYIYIETLDSEAYFKANGEDKNLDYGDSHYVAHPLSPFMVVTASADVTQYNTYNDLLKSGLAFYVYTRLVQLEDLRYTAGTPLTVQLDTRDVFDTKFVQAVLDPMSTPSEQLILIDFVNHEDQCVRGSDHSRLKRYCSMFSHSRLICGKYKMCRWIPDMKVPLDLFETSTIGFNRDSCQPCELTMVPDDSPDDIQSIVISYDNDQFGSYYATAVVNRAGTYNVMASVMSLGGLRLLVYKNPDFTNFIEEERIVAQPDNVATRGGFQLIFDDSVATVSQIFKTQLHQYSAIIQGCIRSDNTTFHNYTFYTNMKMRVYFDNQLILSKDTFQTENITLLDYFIVENQLIDLEILLWDDMMTQRRISFSSGDLQNRTYGFIKMFEETPYRATRVMMPKNMFNIIKTQNTLETIFIIEEDVGSVSNSTFSINATNGEIFRADQRIMFNSTIYDKFANLRNQTRYSDTINAEVWADGVMLSTHQLIKQEESHGKGYYFVYTTELVAELYQILFYLNGELYDLEEFTFKIINANVDVSNSVVTFLEYNMYPQNTLDCIFVHNDIYAIVEMFDLYNNIVLIQDEASWKLLYTFDFSLGGGFNILYCQPFTGIESSSFYEDTRPFDYSYHNNTLVPEPSLHTVICPLRPTVVGSQQLTGMDSNGDRNLIADQQVNVKPYRVRDIDLNNGVHWQATYDSERINLVIQMIDVYGNTIDDNNICDYYWHERLVLYAWFDELGHDQFRLIQEGEIQFSILFTESQTQQPKFNFILFEGIDIENGFLVKYYADNNFQGKSTQFSVNTPEYAEIRKSLIFTPSLDRKLQDLWSKSNYDFKQFSIRTTALINLPFANETFTFSIITSDSLGNINIYLENSLVVSPILLEGGPHRFYHLEILQVVEANTVNASSGVPSFEVRWQSQSMVEQVMGSENAVAVDVEDESAWSYGIKIRKKNYQFD